MGKYRNRLEIIADILSVAKGNAKKNEIMYQANLSYRQMEKYLATLLESGLLECHDVSFYLITWKGKEFLQMYTEYRERCRRIGEEIRGARKDRLLLENVCFSDIVRSDSKEMAREKEVSV